MPIKLLFPLRLLNPSLPVACITTTTTAATMKCGLSVSPSRAMPIFPSIFPFKLKYLGFNGQVGVRRLSTRPFRPRAGPSSEFTRSRRGAGGGGEIRSASKSLIEDEAELSDWVSDLKESELDSDRQTRDRSRHRDGERGRDKIGRESFTAKRRRERESDADEFRESRRIAQNSRASKRFHGYSDDDDKFGSRRRQNMRENNRRENLNSFKGKRGLEPKKRVRFANDEDGFGDFDGEEERKGLRSGIGDLLSEEDSESGDFDYDDDDDSVLRNKASSSLGLDKEVTVRRSLGSSDSYLSETR